MAFSKILAPLHGNGESAIAMNMAVEIAAYFRAHVFVPM